MTEVLLKLLGDEDQRVRHAAASAFCRYFAHSAHCLFFIICTVVCSIVILMPTLFYRWCFGQPDFSIYTLSQKKHFRHF